MEKNKPSCPLSIIKALVASGKYRLTFTAARNGAEIGFNPGKIIAEIMKLEMSEFHKSMTTYENHTIWQDVYHHMSTAGKLYIKLTVIEDVLIVSFKGL